MSDYEPLTLGVAIGIGIGLALGGVIEFFATLYPGAGIGIGLVFGAGIGGALGLFLHSKDR